jgi:hypothetical protein
MLLLNINLIKELLIKKFNINKLFLKELEKKTFISNGKLLILLSEQENKSLIMIIKPDQ